LQQVHKNGGKMEGAANIAKFAKSLFDVFALFVVPILDVQNLLG
jgi:hypothetical protein